MFIRRHWLTISLRSISVVVVAGALLFGVGCGSEAADESSLVTIKKITNQVETNRSWTSDDNDAKFIPAAVGQVLLPGDIVKTFLNSEARVDFRIREFLRITRTKPNTVWQLGQTVLVGNTIIELDQGEVFLLDEEGQSDSFPVKVVTPAGTASPRGTWMSVAHDPTTGVTKVMCFRGICELSNDLGVQVLTDEQKSTTTKNTAPSAPVYLITSEILEFTELPENKRGDIMIPEPQGIGPMVTLVPTSQSTSLSPAPTYTLYPTYTLQPTRTAVPGRMPSAKPVPTTIPAAKPVPTTIPAATPVTLPTATPVLTPTKVSVQLPTPTQPLVTPSPLPEQNTSILPHVFVGSANTGILPASDRTEVSAWLIDFDAPVGTAIVVDGEYTLLANQYGTESFGGRTLVFKLNGVPTGETSLWKAGEATILDLSLD